MDVIINNPPAQTAPVQTVPGYALPTPGYTQGYGPVPAYPGVVPYAYGRDHGGGFFGVFLLIFGGVLLARFLRGRRFWERRARMMGRGAGQSGQAEGQDAEPAGPFDFWHRQRERSSVERAIGIAAERLARGEISAQEYVTIKGALGGE